MANDLVLTHSREIHLGISFVRRAIHGMCRFGYWYAINQRVG